MTKPLLGQPWVETEILTLLLANELLETENYGHSTSPFPSSDKLQNEINACNQFLVQLSWLWPWRPFTESTDTCSLPRNRCLHCAAGGFPLQGLSSCTAHKITILLPLMTASLLWLWWWMSSKHTTKLIQPYGRLSLEAENYKNRLVLITALRLIGKSHSQKEAIMTLT